MVTCCAFGLAAIRKVLRMLALPYPACHPMLPSGLILYLSQTTPTDRIKTPFYLSTPEGKLWLLYASQESQGQAPENWEEKFSNGKLQGIHWMQWTSVIRRRISEDNGHTWGPMETLFDQPGSFCRNRMEILSNGNWLFPMYYSKRDGEGVYGNDISVMQISADKAKAGWSIPYPAAGGGFIPR